MAVEMKDLLGAWRLESWSLVYADGGIPDAQGIIMYTPDGHASATLMRKARPAAASNQVTEPSCAR